MVAIRPTTRRSRLPAPLARQGSLPFGEVAAPVIARQPITRQVELRGGGLRDRVELRSAGPRPAPSSTASGNSPAAYVERTPELSLDRAPAGRRRIVLAESLIADRPAPPAVVRTEPLPGRARMIVDVLGTAFVFLSFLIAAAFF